MKKAPVEGEDEEAEEEPVEEEEGDAFSFRDLFVPPGEVEEDVDDEADRSLFRMFASSISCDIVLTTSGLNT